MHTSPNTNRQENSLKTASQSKDKITPERLKELVSKNAFYVKDQVPYHSFEIEDENGNFPCEITFCQKLAQITNNGQLSVSGIPAKNFIAGIARAQRIVAPNGLYVNLPVATEEQLNLMASCTCSIIERYSAKAKATAGLSSESYFKLCVNGYGASMLANKICQQLSQSYQQALKQINDKSGKPKPFASGLEIYAQDSERSKRHKDNDEYFTLKVYISYTDKVANEILIKRNATYSLSDILEDLMYKNSNRNSEQPLSRIESLSDGKPQIEATHAFSMATVFSGEINHRGEDSALKNEIDQGFKKLHDDIFKNYTHNSANVKILLRGPYSKILKNYVLSGCKKLHDDLKKMKQLNFEIYYSDKNEASSCVQEIYFYRDPTDFDKFYADFLKQHYSCEELKLKAAQSKRKSKSKTKTDEKILLCFQPDYVINNITGTRNPQFEQEDLCRIEALLHQYYEKSFNFNKATIEVHGYNPLEAKSLASELNHGLLKKMRQDNFPAINASAYALQGERKHGDIAKIFIVKLITHYNIK